jgi:hypothetical protein
MLDHLEQSGRQRLVRQRCRSSRSRPAARNSMCPRSSATSPARTRSVLIAPYERMLDSGEPIDYARLSDDPRTPGSPSPPRSRRGCSPPPSHAAASLASRPSAAMAPP